MRNTRLIAALMIFIMLLSTPVVAMDLSSLADSLETSGITAGANESNPLESMGQGIQGLQDSFEGIFDELTNLFSQLLEGLKEIFGDGNTSGGNDGGSSSGGNNGGSTPGTDGGTTSDPGSDGGSSDTSLPPVDDSFKGSYQKNNVVSDREMTDYNSMTAAQIQAFLDRKGSVLARPVNGINPSVAIFNAAQKYKINPRLLLTRAQVEKGLISKKTASQNTLDWAFGCGAYDGGNWNQAYKGFDKQVDGAAKTFRRWYDDGKAKGGQVAIKIDGTNLTTKNAATYALYKYTPHFQGAKLHWDVHRGYWGR